MITGDDTVILVSGDPAVAVERFLVDLHGRWPRMQIALEAGELGSFREWASAPVSMPRTAAVILIARDEQMVSGWDDYGYAIDPMGEGPLMVSYQPTNWNSLKVQVIEDPFSREGFQFLPYEAIIVGAEYYVLTLTTPPLDSQFAKDVVGDMTRILALPGTTGI
jgi:hypothetical protein